MGASAAAFGSWLISGSAGATAALAVGGALLGPSLLEATGLAKKPQTPSMLAQEAGRSQADTQRAANQQRGRAASSEGRASTIKTGPQGLGEIGQQNLETKSLLGY